MRIHDVGVAGIHRLMHHRERLQQARVVIVCAGMEGALPSVVGGLVTAPVIAVPYQRRLRRQLPRLGRPARHAEQLRQQRHGRQYRQRFRRGLRREPDLPRTCAINLPLRRTVSNSAHGAIGPVRTVRPTVIPFCCHALQKSGPPRCGSTECAAGAPMVIWIADRPSWQFFPTALSAAAAFLSCFAARASTSGASRGNHRAAEPAADYLFPLEPAH